jgi:phospholipid transport system transporter-binding protein
MLTLPATLTLVQANEVVRAIEAALGQGSVEKGAFVIDATALRGFDTAAIAVLLEARRLAQAAGRTLSVRAAPAAMVELSGLYGVDGLLGFEPESASASISQSDPGSSNFRSP